MNKYLAHFKTIFTHRKHVRHACFKMGIPWQGLVHDLSKYSIEEFGIAKYYTGTRSPHQNCRDAIGYSPSWILHYHRNKHHFQYFLDDSEEGELIPIKMPYKYVIESFCDMIGAGKAYMKDKWTKEAPWNYYVTKCQGKRLMNKESEYLLKKLLVRLRNSKSEEEFYKWYKEHKNELKTCYANSTMDY